MARPYWEINTGSSYYDPGSEQWVTENKIADWAKPYVTADGGYKSYNQLKSEGLWDLSNPNLLRYFDALSNTGSKAMRASGSAGDWRTSPDAQTTLFGRLGLSTADSLRQTALGFGDPREAFGDLFNYDAAEAARVGQVKRAEENSGFLDTAGGFIEGWGKNFVLPALAVATGVNAIGGALGGAAGGASAGGTAIGAAEGLSNPAWLDALLAETGEAGLSAGALEGGFSAGLGSGTGGGMDWLTELLGETGELGIDPGMLEGGFNAAASNAPWWSGLPTVGQNLVQGASGLGNSILDFLSGNASGGASRLVGGSGVDTALATAPILAAINYAKNQGPFDTSRLVNTYNEFDPDALAFEYDQNTSRGRNALTSSLTQRGVMGSSFGNADLTNFQTSRDIGRRSLVNQGLAQRGNLAATLLDAQIKERGLKNDLYGRSLLALGNVFGGRNQTPVYA